MNDEAKAEASLCERVIEKCAQAVVRTAIRLDYISRRQVMKSAKAIRALKEKP